MIYAIGLRKTSRWAQYHRCALLAINSGHDIDKQLSLYYASTARFPAWQVFVTRAIIICLILPGGEAKKASAPGSS
jgi:hypothetical protein